MKKKNFDSNERGLPKGGQISRIEEYRLRLVSGRRPVRPFFLFSRVITIDFKKIFFKTESYTPRVSFCHTCSKEDDNLLYGSLIEQHLRTPIVTKGVVLYYLFFVVRPRGL